MKRQRGRGRRPGGGGGGGGGQHHQHQHPNRAMESSGPEIKVRGPASHIYERYLQLSRDAAGAGDRVLSENYAQHADHYFRLVRSMLTYIKIEKGARTHPLLPLRDCTHCFPRVSSDRPLIVEGWRGCAHAPASSPCVCAAQIISLCAAS